MLDPKRLRAEPQRIAEQLARRGFAFDAAAFETLEARRKQLQIDRPAAEVAAWLAKLGLPRPE